MILLLITSLILLSMILIIIWSSSTPKETYQNIKFDKYVDRNTYIDEYQPLFKTINYNKYNY